MAGWMVSLLQAKMLIWFRWYLAVILPSLKIGSLEQNVSDFEISLGKTQVQKEHDSMPNIDFDLK